MFSTMKNLPPKKDDILSKKLNGTKTLMKLEKNIQNPLMKPNDRYLKEVLKPLWDGHRTCDCGHVVKFVNFYIFPQ